MFRRQSSRDRGSSSERTAEERARAAAERAARRAERLGEPVEPPPAEVFRLDPEDLPPVPPEDVAPAPGAEPAEREADGHAGEQPTGESSVLDPEPEGFLPDEDGERGHERGGGPVFDTESEDPPASEAIVEASRPDDAIREHAGDLPVDDAAIAEHAARAEPIERAVPDDDPPTIGFDAPVDLRLATARPAARDDGAPATIGGEPDPPEAEPSPVDPEPPAPADPDAHDADAAAEGPGVGRVAEPPAPESPPDDVPPADARRRRPRRTEGPPTVAMPALGARPGEDDPPSSEPPRDGEPLPEPEPEPDPAAAQRRRRRRRGEPPPLPEPDPGLSDDPALDLPPRQPGPPPRSPRRPLPPRSPRPPRVPRRPPAGSRPVTGRGGHPKRPRRPRTARTARWRARLLLAVVLIVCLAFVYFVNGTFQPLEGEPSGIANVRIPEGAGVGDIGTILADADVIDSKGFFELNATITRRRSGLRPGRYVLPKGITNGDALNALRAGPAEKQVETFRLTIAEGRSRRETAARIEANVDSLEGDYLAATDRPSASLLRRLRAPRRTPTLEGFLFPATYELPVGASARDLVDAQLDSFREHVQGISFAYARRRKLTRYDALIIASMVERETMVDRERRIVASVIYNRLEQGMPIAIDATTRYALDNWSRPLTDRDFDGSPYDTRHRRGLPPTPIGNPGLPSIRAAAHPAKTSYLYYVIRPGTCGRHVFRSEYAQFLADQARYNRERERRGGRSPVDC